MIIKSIVNHIELPIKDSEQAQRLFHGRGHAYDGLHHLTIDWLPPVILITLFATEDDQSIANLATQLLQKIPDCKSIQLQHRYKLHGPIDVIYNDNLNNNFKDLIIEENKLKYQLQLGKAQNTGLFLDMKNGRKWVQEHSKNKHVLNLFSYTCGFSVAAIAGGAKSIVNVDMSSPALNVGRVNHRLNNHDLNKVRFEKLNILKSFGRLKKRGPFDLLICDPPTLQKGSVNIIKDYPKIMRRLNEFMAPHSILMLCLNAPELDRDFLIENMGVYASSYQFTEEIKPPSVYIDAQDKGLKVLVFHA